MANLHSLLLEFDKKISLSPKRKDGLKESRLAVEETLIRFFRKYNDISNPKFYIQGSYKMGPIILKNDNTYDVDLGIYFSIIPDIKANTLQKYVADAVSNQTDSGVQHKEKCVRIIYKGEFNIDLPVYFFPDSKSHPKLATKSGWEKSDPTELVDWFCKKKDKNGQLVRIVKYMKFWANPRAFKMPSGIALTVWAARYYKEYKRDDKALLYILESVHLNTFLIIECKNPATSKDDLLSKLEMDQKRRFRDSLSKLISSIKQAMNEENEMKAINILLPYFGERFG
jgi:hypothetical protein